MKPSEIRRYANALVRWHSDFAPAHAARRAEKLMSQGDPEGAKEWRRIEKRITRQQSKSRELRSAGTPRGPARREPMHNKPRGVHHSQISDA